MKKEAAQSDKYYPAIPLLEAEVRDAFTRERSKWNALVKYQQTVGEGPTEEDMMHSVRNPSLGKTIALATEKRIKGVLAHIQEELDTWQHDYAETFLLKERGASAARLLTVLYYKAHENTNTDTIPNVLRAAGISLASFLGVNPSTVLKWMRWKDFTTSQVDSVLFITGADVTTSDVPEWQLGSDILPSPLDSMRPLKVDVAGEIKILQSDPKHMFPAMMAGALDAYEGNEVSGHKQFTGALWASLLVSNSKPMWTSFGSMCVNKIIGLSDALSGIISTSVQAGGGLTDHATALKDSILSRAEVLMKNIDTGDAMTATACLNLPLIMFVNDVDWMRTKFKCEMDSSGKVSAATSVDVASACHRMWGTKNIFVSGATARRAQTCNPDDLKKLFQNVEEHEGERERERERSGDAKLFLRAGGSISASEAAAQLLESMRGGSGGTAGDADDDDDSEENEENEVLSGVNGGSSSCGTADDAVQNTAVLT